MGGIGHQPASESGYCGWTPSGAPGGAERELHDADLTEAEQAGRAKFFACTVVPARVYTDASGIFFEVPVLLTPQGHADFVLDYLLAHWDTRSPTWMLRVTAAVRLLLDYLHVHTNWPDEQALFQNFRRRLLTGTVSASLETDPSGLWWSAKGPDKTNKIIRRLTNLFDWWAEKNPGKRNPAATWRGSPHDQRLAEAALLYRRNKAFLGHTWSTFEETSRRPGSHAASGKWHQTPRTEKASPAAFPEDRLLDLVLRGFRVGRRFNYRDALITLLLNGAGFRESEPFHLYFWDVKEDPTHKGQALVLIHHPAWGSAPDDPNWRNLRGEQRRGTRAEYLAERFGLSPRDWGYTKGSAGWKGGMHEKELSGFYKQAYWFLPELGELFWKLWNRYAQQVLSIDPSQREHPYAFMNLMGTPRGGIYKLGKFETSHARAVRRIGLEPSRELGTNIHGHRHAYGQRLRKAGIPKEMIRRFMHHSSLESQDVYTEASRMECLLHLEQAAKRLNGMTADLRAQIAGADLSHLGLAVEG